MLGSIGPTELGVILLIVILLFGARKLPQLGKNLGEGLRSFRAVGKALEEEDG